MKNQDRTIEADGSKARDKNWIPAIFESGKGSRLVGYASKFPLRKGVAQQFNPEFQRKRSTSVLALPDLRKSNEAGSLISLT